MSFPSLTNPSPTTSMPPFFTDPSSSNNNNNNNNTNNGPFDAGLDDTSGSGADVIAGSIIGAILLVMCIVGAYVLYNRRRASKMARRAAVADAERGGEARKPSFDVPLPRYPEPAAELKFPPPYSKDAQAAQDGVTSPPIFEPVADNIELRTVDASSVPSSTELGRPPQYTRT